MTIDSTTGRRESPPTGDLRQMMLQKPIPQLPEGLLSKESIDTAYATEKARQAVGKLASALKARDSGSLADCFFDAQAYWKDNLALTSGTFSFDIVDGSAVFVPATPTLKFIDCDISFETKSPAASCSGRAILLPQKDEDGALQWKIWVLFTRLEALHIQAEDPKLLHSPRTSFLSSPTMETDVLIVGAGNAAAALSARLKALNIQSLMLERNSDVGDNWRLRYDCLKFHVPTSFCELPFLDYDTSLRAPRLLTRNDLANQLRKFFDQFNLNVITSASITSTTYNVASQRWTVKFSTPCGERTAICSQLVLATGVGSQKPYIPRVQNSDRYKGVNIHSNQLRNAEELRARGLSSVAIVGAANTAFDVAEDCVKAGLYTTMVARSPTYVVPLDYIVDQRSLGSYDLGVAASDRMYLTLPIVVDAALAKGLFAMMASAEPGRYSATLQAGFPVLDSTDPSCALMHNLIERGGGHYVDIGGTKLIDEGTLKVKAGVEPVSYSERGLLFTDGTQLEADAVIWCTGFKDKDVRQVAAEILGLDNTSDEPVHGVLGAKHVSELMDATWGLDTEGEVRGMWKRHSRIDNLWVMGGYTQQHRWHSKTLALQIQAKLAGVLPEAYRGAP